MKLVHLLEKEVTAELSTMTLAELCVLLLMLGRKTAFGRDCVLDSDCEQSQQFGRIQAIQVHI